jgi:leader peptidase (prepilin peptidase)/N-methyltransferase
LSASLIGDWRLLYPGAFALGLVLGSFANVVIYRLPRGRSVAYPPSSCPGCGTPIKPWDNMPIVSYLLLEGKCRACGAHISAKYPLVEAANGLLFFLVAFRYGASLSTLFHFALATALVIITFIDLEFQIIPDEITIPGTLMALIAGWLFLADPFSRNTPLGIKASLIGAASGFGLYYIIAVISKGGMGGGDIKMMAMVGAALGWKGVLLTTFSGSLLGSAAGIYLMAFRGRGRKTKIPFGPFLAIGALISLFFGQEISSWYARGWR